MKRTLLYLALAVASALCFVPAAQAANVNQSQSWAGCYKVDGSPGQVATGTVWTSVLFENFVDQNKPVNYAVYLDGRVVQGLSSFTFAGSSYRHAWSKSRQVFDNGTHTLTYRSNWLVQSGGGYARPSAWLGVVERTFSGCLISSGGTS